MKSQIDLFSNRRQIELGKKISAKSPGTYVAHKQLQDLLRKTKALNEVEQ